MIKLAKAEDVEKLRNEVKDLAEKGGAGSICFGTCTDTRDTLAKTVTVDADGFALSDGVTVTVRFNNGLRSTTFSEGATTLNINGTGAKELWINGVDSTAVENSTEYLYVESNGVIAVTYNATSDTYAIVGRESVSGGIECFTKNVQWVGKKWVALGTSITSETQGQYVTPLANLSGLTVTNHGVPGCKMGSHILYYAQNSTALANADIVTIEGSVNDYASSMPLGTVGDTMSYSYSFTSPEWDNGGTDKGTFAGACYQVFKAVLENAPNAVVICLTDTIGQHVSGTGAYYNREAKNEIGLSQGDYNNMLKSVAEYMGIIVIDTATLSGITQERPAYYADHIHHSELGGKQFAETIWGGLKNIKPLILATNDENFFITNNLTNVTTSNPTTQIADGEAYSATLTANDGYTLNNVIVTMGGVDVTSTAYDDGVITIETVTGSVVITASAELASAEVIVDIEAIGYTDNARWSTTDGTIRTGVTGLTAINLIPLTRTSSTVTITLSGIDWSSNSNSAIIFYEKETKVDARQLHVESTSTVHGENGSVIVTLNDMTLAINGFKCCGLGSGANASITIIQ